MLNNTCNPAEQLLWADTWVSLISKNILKLHDELKPNKETKPIKCSKET